MISRTEAIADPGAVSPFPRPTTSRALSAAITRGLHAGRVVEVVTVGSSVWEVRYHGSVRAEPTPAQ